MTTQHPLSAHIHELLNNGEDPVGELGNLVREIHCARSIYEIQQVIDLHTRGNVSTNEMLDKMTYICLTTARLREGDTDFIHDAVVDTHPGQYLKKLTESFAAGKPLIPKPDYVYSGPQDRASEDASSPYVKRVRRKNPALTKTYSAEQQMNPFVITLQNGATYSCLDGVDRIVTLGLKTGVTNVFTAESVDDDGAVFLDDQGFLIHAKTSERVMPAMGSFVTGVVKFGNH